jgi:arsenate reductase
MRVVRRLSPARNRSARWRAISAPLCLFVHLTGFEVWRMDLARACGCAMTNTIYGIKNCDTMKKARAWLDAHGVAYDFHDYKSAGIAPKQLEAWCKEVGWEVLLNRAGTAFRALPEADKTGLTEKKAIALMLAQPSMIKRPVLDLGGRLLVGFKPDIYQASVGARR